MRKLCGYDVNGWRDRACRNWSLSVDGDLQKIDTLIHGGELSSLVMTGTNGHEAWIGGVQAELAPHGMGLGWGDVGSPERRKSVWAIFNNPDRRQSDLTAAFSSLNFSADFAIAAIDDLVDSNESLQEQLLSALRSSGVRRPLLVWRSVLVTLDAIDKGYGETGQTIGVISHCHKGYAVQHLTLKSEIGDHRVLAPERRAFGTLYAGNCGYETLHKLAREQVLKLMPNMSCSGFEWSRSIRNLMFGLTSEPEVLRLDNGDWHILDPQNSLDLATLTTPQNIGKALGGCDLILFETQCEGILRDHLTKMLLAELGRDIIVCSSDCVARGGRLAAERLSLRQAIYYDFLPQISTIVQGQQGAENFDLIERGTLLPAGQIYRSKTPAQFLIQAGQSNFSLYLKKELAKYPRKAVIETNKVSSSNEPLELWVEQSPVSGKAKLLLTSSEFDTDRSLDWEQAEQLNDSWSDLLEQLAPTKPTIPKRLVLPCGIEAWEVRSGSNSFASLLERNAEAKTVDWERLQQALTARAFGKFTISSDGALPEEIPTETIEALNRLTERAVIEFTSQVGVGPVASTDSLKFLTWQFRRCPDQVAAILLDVLLTEEKTRAAFPKKPQWVLLFQGLGRIASEEAHEKEAIDLLLSKPLETWNWRRETAAMAFLLSRSENAPRFLSRHQVELLADRVLLEFEENLGTKYDKFHYAPFLLVGLLRRRLIDPFTLTVGYDAVADRFVECVTAAMHDPTLKRDFVKARKYLPILEQILDELKGAGTNHELLLSIYSS